MLVPTLMSSESFYIGVDVGTGSVRVSLVGQDGTVVASATKETFTYRDADDHRIFEQSTTNIWSCIATTIKLCLADAKIPPSAVKGLGFDATCSLAVCTRDGEPVTVTKGPQLGQLGDRNIVLWADHRAEHEAELITTTKSVVLDYLGGTMSLEMEVPKVLWLKNHMAPALFARCQFFDLPDFLTYRATADSTRSCCSVTCKCTFVPQAGWQADFFCQIGLGQLVVGKYEQLGAATGKVLTAGMPVGQGLSKTAAEEFGLVEGTPVGSGLIDAYAGWLGTIAARHEEHGELFDTFPSIEESQNRLAAVAGTSTCYIVQSPTPFFVKGVWGPYKDPVFPGWWMNEGGQSSTGQLIDFIVTTHPAYPDLMDLAKQQQKDVHSVMQGILETIRVEQKAGSLTELIKDMHMYPDFHGNRSPIGDARMRGSIVGLDLDSGLNDLARKYHLTLESLALQTRHIIDTLNAGGHCIDRIYMSGGQVANASLMQLMANVCGMLVVLPPERAAAGAVVRGAAMLGRFAAEAHAAGHEGGDEGQRARLLWKIMAEMTPAGTLVEPAASQKEKKLLEAKYRIFREAIDIQKRWRGDIESASQYR